MWISSHKTRFRTINDGTFVDKTLVEAVSTPARNVGAETPVIVAQITPAANPSQPVDCTPLQPPEPTTPGPRVISGTPAMPPPPLRSAMKK